MNELFHNGVEKERMVVTTPDEALSRRAEWTRVRNGVYDLAADYWACGGDLF